MLAAALDKLDQTLNPIQSAQSSGQQKQSSQQSAQENLSQARENQQQSMADQRNQGQTPGSRQPSSQMAQSNQPPKSDNPQASQEGGNFQTTLKDGALGKEIIMVGGDWGHLPSRMAEDLTEATRQEAAPEYRAAIESYYKAIATKAKK
jgi:predicted ATP-dependent serine protease